MQAQPGRISIRFAGPADAGDLRRLAELDSAAASSGDALVAEVDGRVRAALPVAGGRVIADPFEPSAELASLLELRARQLRADRGASGAAASAARHPLRALAHALPPHWGHA
ncbi:MAG TPA: hypothetical protein VF712_07835 [Thermoleophilaceae bacterium]